MSGIASPIVSVLRSWLGLQLACGVATALAAGQPASLGAPSPPAPTLSAAAILQDCEHCPELVAIPAGRFLMGTGEGEEEREALAEPFRGRSEPRREVRIDAFLAGRVEVTRGQFEDFARATGHRAAACFRWQGGEFRLDPERDWRSPGYAQSNNHPVTCVSWEDAQAYVRWLSARSGKRYRLLSEAEWEYAARGDRQSARFWGEDPADACRFANVADRTTLAAVPEANEWHAAPCSDGYGYTAPTGRFQPNAFGLFDMLGNVAEWTQDCWNGNHDGAPADGRPRQSGDCFLRVVRGGSWEDGPVGVRAAYRVGSPVVIRVYTRGFRVARDP